MARHAWLVLFLIFLNPYLSAAQSNPLTKKLAHAAELYEANKQKEADEYLVDVLKSNPDFGQGWDMLVALRGKEYEQAQQYKVTTGEQKVTVTTKDKNGKKVDAGVDSMAQQLAQMLNSMSPSKRALSKYLYTIRKALLHSSEAYQASMIWRLYNIDVEVDSNVSRKAIKYYEDAEKEYEAKNYASAARLYRRAIEEQPDFYKAKLYLGDAFYASENYADAIRAFQDGVTAFPDLLEPRKYLTDAYAKMKLYDKALNEAIGAMSVYPDLSMVAKMEDAAYLVGKKIDIRWTPRGVFPNRITTPHIGMPDLNEYADEEKIMPSAPWTFYTGTLERAELHCDEKGSWKMDKVADQGLVNAIGDEIFLWYE